jgi:hypothetical protein
LSSKYVTFEFGCLPPTGGSEAALDQMLGRCALWNALVEIERAHHDAVLRILADPKIPGTVRRRARLSAGEQGRLEELGIARKAAVKKAQADSGLYWCNYDDVIQAYERARKQARNGAALRGRQWDGTGKVAVRFQTGLPAAAVFAQDTRLQIDPIDAAAWSDPRRSARRRLSRSTARIRIGTVKRGEPIWLELPIVVHRPLPDDGLVRAASAVRERIGGRWRWRLLLTVERRSEVESRRGPAVAVDVGWWPSDGELRVASWEDECGEHGELVLAKDLLSRFQKIDELKSERARRANEIRSFLIDWSRRTVVPEWMDWEAARGAATLLRALEQWQNSRFDGDMAAFDAAAEWRRRHRHFKVWEEHLRDQTLRRRRDLYRQFVAALVARHGTVFVEDADLRAAARRGDGSDRVIACSSLLLRLFEDKGGVVHVPSLGRDVMSHCHRDRARELLLLGLFACSACRTATEPASLS